MSRAAQINRSAQHSWRGMRAVAVVATLIAGLTFSGAASADGWDGGWDGGWDDEWDDEWDDGWDVGGDPDLTTVPPPPPEPPGSGGATDLIKSLAGNPIVADVVIPIVTGLVKAALGLPRDPSELLRPPLVPQPVSEPHPPSGVPSSPRGGQQQGQQTAPPPPSNPDFKICVGSGCPDDSEDGWERVNDCSEAPEEAECWESRDGADGQGLSGSSGRPAPPGVVDGDAGSDGGSGRDGFHNPVVDPPPDQAARAPIPTFDGPPDPGDIDPASPDIDCTTCGGSAPGRDPFHNPVVDPSPLQDPRPQLDSDEARQRLEQEILNDPRAA